LEAQEWLIAAPSTSTCRSWATTLSRTSKRRLRSLPLRKVKTRTSRKMALLTRRRQHLQIKRMPLLLLTRREAKKPRLLPVIRSLLMVQLSQKAVIKQQQHPRRMLRSPRMRRKRVVRRRPPSLRQRRLSSRKMASSLRLTPRRRTSKPLCPATLTCRWSTMSSTRSRNQTLP